jgi:hypothetical protein
VKSFGTPLDFTMSIFPLIYRKIISRETNDSAHINLEHQLATSCNRAISGSRWTHDTPFQKILQFYGILMMVVLFPFPGATYIIYWRYGSPMFPSTNTITIRRFKQLHSVLHFNSNMTEVKGKYTLHKMRHLMKILKKKLGVFLIPGSEMELGDSSRASQSNYGSELVLVTQKITATSFIFDFTFSVMHQHLFVLHSKL